MFCAPSAQDLELAEPTLEGIIEALRPVPFEPAMLACSLIAGILFHHPRDRRRHLALSAELHRPWLADRMRRFLAADASHVGFDQRHVAALQRLLVTHAAPEPEGGPTRGMTKDEVEHVMLALIGLASVLPQLEPPDDPRTRNGDIDPTRVDWAGWASYTVRAGVWYGEPYIAEAMARAHAFYVDVHGSRELSGHPARCDIEAWVTQRTGLTLAQQLAGALACAIKTAALLPTATIEERAKHIEPGFLSEGSMADLEPRLREAISATRSDLAAMLNAGGQDSVRIAWDHTAFEQRPLLRRADGSMRLISPRGLVSWMTRGIHHRALQAAEGQPHPRKPETSMSMVYLGYTGALGEEAVRRLLATSHRVTEQAGAVRLHGEHSYKIGKKKHLSPDAALDFGTDLVLIEVYAGRVALAARAGADSELMLNAMDKATSGKLKELADRTRELLSGDLTYSGFDLGRAQRIWPVLVLAGDPILQTPALWAYLRQRAPNAFLQDSRVRRPIILALDDLEPMLAQIERGAVLPEMLAELLGSAYAELPPRNWMNERFPGSLARRPAYVREQYEAAARMAARALYPDSEDKIEIRERDGL